MLEIEAAGLAVWRQLRAQLSDHPALMAASSRTLPLVDCGRGELYTVEAQG